MKSITISNSKYKNTGVLFELLVRQVTSETLTGKDSPALDIMKKYFNKGTEMGKELQLYRVFFDSQKPLSETKALDFIDLIINQRKKLDERKLANEKFNLIREVKENYELSEFLSCKIPSYTLHASIYKTFLNEAVRNKDFTILNIRDVATARFTLVEHLVTKKRSTAEASIFESFRKESEETRLLAHKLAVDKFNDRYANLNEKQKLLLREFINNVSTSNSLLKYIRNEIPIIKNELMNGAKKSKDKVTAIKLTEVAHQLNTIGTNSVIKDSEITALMIAYEIIKEAS